MALGLNVRNNIYSFFGLAMIIFSLGYARDIAAMQIAFRVIPRGK